MAEISKKKRIRAGHRLSATKILSQVGEATSNRETNRSKLLQLKTSLREKMDVLERLDKDILELMTEEGDFDEEIQTADDCREKLQLALIELDGILTSEDVHSPTVGRSPEGSRVESPTSLPRTTPSPVSEVGSVRSDASVVHTTKVKLPKLTLKRFSGDLTTWTTFWDSFESAVHNNPDLSSIDKFNYLHSLLERTAVDAISGLTLTAANYKEAIEILKKTIVNKHMDTLLNLEAVTSYNLKGLRNLFDKVESQVRGLKSLGVPSST